MFINPILSEGFGFDEVFNTHFVALHFWVTMRFNNLSSLCFMGFMGLMSFFSTYFIALHCELKWAKKTISPYGLTSFFSTYLVAFWDIKKEKGFATFKNKAHKNTPNLIYQLNLVIFISWLLWEPIWCYLFPFSCFDLHF